MYSLVIQGLTGKKKTTNKKQNQPTRRFEDVKFSSEECSRDFRDLCGDLSAL